MYFRINNGTETYLTTYLQHLQKQQPGEESDYENIVVVNLVKTVRRNACSSQFNFTLQKKKNFASNELGNKLSYNTSNWRKKGNLYTGSNTA